MDENYDVMFGSALEAIREHPGVYLRGVADTFWEFLRQKPLRENVVPREQTEPERPTPTFESDGVVLPNPQASILLVGVPYGFVWCASDYIDSCTLADPAQVYPDPSTQARYREVVSQVRAWDAELPRREGTASSRRSSTASRPAIRRPCSGSQSGSSRWSGGVLVAGGTIVLLWVAAFLVLLIHAASQGVAPEFALPVYPVFIVTAVCALAGERGGQQVGS